jgi:hypothetical protein
MVLNNLRYTKITLGPKKNKKSQQKPSFFPVEKTDIPDYKINAGRHFVEDEMNTRVCLQQRASRACHMLGSWQLRIRLTEMIFGQVNGFCIMSIILSGIYCV